MADLIVVGFEGTRRAAEVLHQVQALNENWTVDLRDAVAAYRTHDGRLRVDQSVMPTSTEGAAWGGLLGGLLGAILAAPFTGGASVAAAAMGTSTATAAATLVGGASRSAPPGTVPSTRVAGSSPGVTRPCGRTSPSIGKPTSKSKVSASKRKWRA
jgi:hypothetical protein